jgi:signal transduction histidine kinase
MTLDVQGELHYADVMVYPLMADGASGAVIRMDDVTARVRIESKMVQTEKMLSVGGLAAGMAHEINNPLGAILQGSQNILRRVAPDMPQNRAVANAIGVDLDRLHRYLEQRQILHFLEGIREAGARAAKIVADMLSFSRRSESHFALVEVEEMLETVLRLAASDYDLKKKYDFKRIAINRDYDPALRLVYCDKTEIEQVILNLLKNAAQAMAEAGIPTPVITLRTRREALYALIEVVDNGPGMDEKTLKRIFEPFFTTKEVGAGTGLGLSVSYFIVTEQHNGRLSVMSKPGQGARFSIRLPLTREALP